MSFCTRTHFTCDETEARRTAGGQAHTQTEQAGTVASVMADEVTQTNPPAANNQKSRQNMRRWGEGRICYKIIESYQSREGLQSQDPEENPER